jgi:alpha-galactosidase
MIAFFGTYGYEMNPNNLKTSEVEELSEIKELYHQYHQSVVEDGVVYHLMNPNISDFVALESVSSNQESALLLLMNKLKDHDHYYSLKLLGLKDEYQYQNDLDNQVHSGQYYRLVGLRFSRSWFNEFNCRIIKIIKKK